MKYRNFRARIFGGVLLAALAMVGCGSEDLVVSPEGPTIVEKGTTLQFSANKSNVTWSVEGGNGNGTIDSTGLYTPPSTLPVDDSEVTVLAQSGNDSASATVSLRTGDEISFGPEVSVSQGVTAATVDLGMGFMGNRLAVGLGSVHETSVFSDFDGSEADLFFAKALDLGNYQTPVNLSQDSVDSALSSAVEMDSNLNPHILYGQGFYGAGVRLMLVSSTDQGATFGEPVPLLDDADTQNDQIMAAMVVDVDDNLHVVFSRINNTNATSAILYVRSGDGGATWTSPTTVKDGSEDLIFPNVAVSPDGNSVYVVYFDGEVPNNFFARSTDGGATFGEGIPVSENDPSSNLAFPFPDIAVDVGGNIYLGLSQDPEGDDQLTGVVRKSTDGGETFGPAAPVVTGGTDSQIFLNVAVDDLGRVDVAWTLADTALTEFHDIFYARSVDGGATFGAPQPVVEDPAGTIAIIRGFRHDEAGRLYIEYIVADDVGTGDGEIFSRRAE